MQRMEPANRAVPNSKYALGMLTLSGLTATLAVAAPTMAMPVLFAEIAEELGLTLVQIGAVWGLTSFAGLFASLAGGMIVDRFGTRRTLIVSLLLLGLAGASRGLSNSLLALSITVFLAGALSAVIPMNLHKVCAIWFSGRRLGMANAVVSGGMALGFMLGSFVSATILSPCLGGWRWVLFFYGGIGILMSVPWALTRASQRESGRTPHAAAHGYSFRRSLSHVARLRDVWILGLALFGVGGAVQGLLGYLPLYLRGIEWSAVRADATLSSFHAMSLLAVFPLAMLSDRIGSRRKLLVAASLATACGIGLLSIVDGVVIWVAVLMAGAVRDGFMAVYMTAVTEVDGVGSEYAGTALGLALTLLRVGALIAPPLGNAFAAYGPRMPFVLWAGMALFGFAALWALGHSKRKRRLDAELQP
jgi:MFS family permease